MPSTNKEVTTCASFLFALFQKQRQKQHGRCSCLCHTYQNKNKSSTQLTEMNDNKFFNCKCNHDCQERSKCSTKLRHQKRKKKQQKNVRIKIEHTGSLSSLQSPSRPNCTCDKLRNTLTFCASFPGRPRIESVKSPMHDGYCKFRHTIDREKLNSPSIKRITSAKMNTDNDGKQEDHIRPKSFYEWTIPFENIELGDLEAVSPKGPVYRGRWHGEVMFYTRSHQTEEEINDFHEEVALLGLIRHENVVLFMGACICPPNLAVVTSVRKGYTLHAHLHTRLTSFHFTSKFSISKQIAQGMGYLHAKGITLGKLCSRNIYLESKVKIGITDYLMNNAPTAKSNYGCIPKGHLSYICPELMKTVFVNNLYLTPKEKATQSSDVFAYGTLLYETFLGRYPYNGLHPEIIIWKISTGEMQSLDETDFPASFKTLIHSCWSYEASKRPQFHEILASMKKFNIPRSLQKKLSLSDSGAINKQQNLSSPFHRLHAGSPSQSARWRKER